MEELRRHFSSESIEKLAKLNKDLQNADASSDLRRGEIFRALHTVKGNSQTFGFASASRLAHQLESLLSAGSEEVFTNENIKNLFGEGIELLIQALRGKHFEIPRSFTEKLAAIVPDSAERSDFRESLLPKILSEISSQLSGLEKNALVSAFGGGKNIYCLEVGFDSTNFAAGFKNLRETLSASGEIIAALPSPKFNGTGKIGFRLLFASSLSTGQIQKIAEGCAAQIIFDTSETVFLNDLPDIAAQVVEYGKTIAEKLGKKIEFEVSAAAAPLAPQKLQLIFDLLVHLTRNAVDHAIESRGKITIELKVEADNLKLSVSDDGRGIDFKKIRARAAEKNLISAAAELTEQEALDLIFTPEFSTASELTEISGRGIGLDAVKHAVETADGKINVRSRTGKGTTFEIFLPKGETNAK